MHADGNQVVFQNQCVLLCTICVWVGLLVSHLLRWKKVQRLLISFGDSALKGEEKGPEEKQYDPTHGRETGSETPPRNPVPRPEPTERTGGTGAGPALTRKSTVLHWAGPGCTVPLKRCLFGLFVVPADSLALGRIFGGSENEPVWPICGSGVQSGLRPGQIVRGP